MIACVIGISYYYNFFYFGGTSFSNTSLTVSPSFPFPCSDVIFIFLTLTPIIPENEKKTRSPVEDHVFIL